MKYFLFEPLKKNWEFSVSFFWNTQYLASLRYIILVLNDNDYCNNAGLLYIVYTGSCGIIYTDKRCKNTDFKIIVKSVVLLFV